MTEIPTLEKIKGSKCNTCLHKCEQMCGTCGKTFCTKHMIAHSKGCKGYGKVVQAILRDEMGQTMSYLLQTVLQAI